MPGCGNCQRGALPVQAQAPLFQIQQSFGDRWNGLALSVQMDFGQWMCNVRDEASNQTIYTAYRGGANAAKLAAAEFAILKVLGFESAMSPGSLAQSLQWRPRW